MALAVVVRIDFVDEVGESAFTEIPIPTGFAISDMITFAEAAIDLVHQLSTARITGASITVDLSIATATLKVSPSAFADLAQRAHFIFNTVVGGFTKLFKIPTLDELTTVVGSNDINTSLPDVADFVTLITDGEVVTGGVITFCDGYVNDINALASASEGTAT
jgi:hypothetical protein